LGRLSSQRLRQRGLTCRNFLNDGTERPMVIGWMPAISIYFHDPVGLSLELIAMLPDQPRPDLGVLWWEEWQTRSTLWWLDAAHANHACCSRIVRPSRWVTVSPTPIDPCLGNRMGHFTADHGAEVRDKSATPSFLINAARLPGTCCQLSCSLWTEYPCVAGSIPTLPSSLSIKKTEVLCAVRRGESTS